MSKMVFIKIYNELFNYTLKPSAFKVYVYLSGVFYWTDKVTVKLETIALKCGISINTAQRAINELQAAGLIHKTECYINHKRTTNQYKIKRLTGGFVILDKNILKMPLDKSSFMILSYVFMRSNSSCKAYPSLSKIVSGTGISKATVIAKIKALQETGFLYKEKYVCLEGDYGNNNHTVFRLRFRAVLIWMLAKSANHFDELISAAKHSMKYIHFNKKILSIVAKIICLFCIVKSYLGNGWRDKNTP